MNREELLKAMTNRQPIEVEVSFGVVKLMPLTRSQFDYMFELIGRLQKDMTADRNGAIRWWVLANCWVDDAGQKVLEANSKEDRALFDTFSAGDTEKMFEILLDRSQVSKEDRDFFSKG
jgi:hypothetical protein